MARLLAVDWDQREVRYVLANTRGQQLSIAEVASRAFSPGGGDGFERRDAGAWLRAELARHRWGRAETLIGLDRANIELLHMDLPPARDDELPELVRNQAMRESAQVTDDSLLDFFPLPTEGDDRKVTAMALSHAMLDEIKALCSAAGVVPKRMVVRPYAATSLFIRLVDPADGICLLISRFAEEVDLTVVDHGNVVFWRTIQLPSGAGQDASTDALLAELRRTLVVVQNLTRGDPIQRIYVLGDAQTHEELIRKVAEQLSLEAAAVGPFAAVDGFAGDIPEGSGRYAAVLGMLLDEAEGRAPAVDFLHPRRKPAPPNWRRTIALATALAAVIFLGTAYTIWGKFAELETEMLQLAEEIKKLEQAEKKAAKQQEIVAAIRAWKSGDVTLLDELRDLSLRLPKARDMVVQKFSKSKSRSGWCTIKLQGLVRDPNVVNRMERNLRDQFHEVQSPSQQAVGADELYTWRFDSEITVVARDKSQYALHLPIHLLREQEAKPTRSESREVGAQPAPKAPPPKEPGSPT